MNVASLELCRELYELSGWGDTRYIHYSVKGQLVQDTPSEENPPAYTLDYLLRKLRPYMYLGLHIQARDDGFEMMLELADDNIGTEPMSLENAAAKLAIQLFKQGVLTREKEL